VDVLLEPPKRATLSVPVARTTLRSVVPSFTLNFSGRRANRESVRTPVSLTKETVVSVSPVNRLLSWLVLVVG
jgi:hypothetical protein